MGANSARNRCEAWVILGWLVFLGGELQKDLPFPYGFPNAAGNGCNPAVTRRGQAKDSFHRLKYH